MMRQTRIGYTTWKDPTTAASVRPPADSPCLEYPVFIAKPGAVHVDLITGASLNVQPDRGLRVAVSFDDQAPQILDAFADQSYADPSKRGDPSSPPIKDWANWVRDNIKTLKSKHTITEPGVHTLKVWMVDPGMVLEKLVAHDGKLPKIYFGPPEVSLDRRDIQHSGLIDSIFPSNKLRRRSAQKNDLSLGETQEIPGVFQFTRAHHRSQFHQRR